MVFRWKVQRYCDGDGRTLFFAAFRGTRSRGWVTFRPDDVPTFEGEAATFEVSRAKGRWVIGPRLD
ncbi:MAG TPA: hypothetical protein VGL58_04600 [Caulobacteraceae bacterium]|jgi:hypothetical protein